MVSQKDDYERSLRSLFLLLLFLLMALVASTDHGDFHPASRHVELSHATDVSGHDAITGKPVHLPADQSCFATDLKNRTLFPFSSWFKISDYNRQMAQRFVSSCITALALRPPFPDLYLNLPHNRNDIPDLS